MFFFRYSLQFDGDSCRYSAKAGPVEPCPSFRVSQKIFCVQEIKGQKSRDEAVLIMKILP